MLYGKLRVDKLKTQSILSGLKDTNRTLLKNLEHNIFRVQTNNYFKLLKDKD